MATKKVSHKEEDVVEEARKNIEAWFNVFGENIWRGEEDREFAYESQWTAQEKSNFVALNKPDIQINKIYPAIRHICAQQRKMDPQIRVMARDFVTVGSDEKLIADQKKLDLYQNLFRTISYDSNAKSSYKCAYEEALSAGFSSIWATSDYVSDKSMEQRPFIDYIPRENSFFDINAKKRTKYDGEFCGYYEKLTKEEFERRYPGEDWEDAQSMSEQYRYTDNFVWQENDTLTIAHYFRKEYEKKTLVKIETGQTLFKDEYERLVELIKKQQLAQQEFISTDERVQDPSRLGNYFNNENLITIPKVLASRPSQQAKIYHYEITATKVLEREEFPSEHLPGAFVDGDSYYLHGVQYTQSFVKQLRQPQRIANYCMVEMIDAMQKGRRETWTGTDEMIEGHEQEWRNPSSYQGMLRYNPDMQGRGPESVPPSEMPRSLPLIYEAINKDFQEVLGLHKAALGNMDGAGLSGVATQQLIHQGSSSYYIYQDNLLEAQQQIGRCIMSMIPRLYDTTRRVVVTKHDNEQEEVTLNQRQPDGTVQNDMTTGDYTVVIEAGPSYELQKRENLQALMTLLSIQSPTLPLVADLVADNIDVGNRKQLVERFRTLVPESIKAKEEGKVPEPPPPAPPNPEMMLEQAKIAQRDKEIMIKATQEAKELQFKERQQKEEALQNERDLLLDAIKFKSEADSTNTQHHLENKRIDAESERTRTTAQTNLGKLITDLVKVSSESKR